MSWIDTHCHLQSFIRKGELETVVQRAEEGGVEKVITVGTSPEDWTDYQQLSKDYDQKIYYSAGLHPGYVDESWAEQLSTLGHFWKTSPRPVALGEVGLDYFRLPADARKAEEIVFWQKQALRQQLHLARELGCPVIIHSRAAFEDCVSEIDRSGVNWEQVVFHCFTEGVTEIAKLMERGGWASFTGIITFPKNENLSQAIKYYGAEKLMIETDSPYLAPVPYRGKRNEPSFLPLIGAQISELLQIPLPGLAEKILTNSHVFFDIVKK